jgi:hypothetical protein
MGLLLLLLFTLKGLVLVLVLEGLVLLWLIIRLMLLLFLLSWVLQLLMLLLFLFGLLLLLMLLFLFSGLLLELLETTERREEDALLDSLKDDRMIHFLCIFSLNTVRKRLRLSQHTAIQTKKLSLKSKVALEMP